MTARANSVTDRVSRAGTVHLWSMPGTDVRTFVSGLEHLGYDRASLLTAAGVANATLDDPDARVPCEALGAMLGSAQRQRFTPNVALELARVTPVGAHPLLDYVVATSDTTGAGIRQLARYLRLIGNPVAVHIDGDRAGDDDREGIGDVRVRMENGAAPFSVEFLAALMVLHLRSETDGAFNASSIHFRHVPDDAAAMGRALGCAVHAASTWDGVTISRQAWQLPLRRRDPVLRRVLECHAEEVLDRLPKRNGLAVDVQRALAARVAGGDTSISAVARQLAMSNRTLQRRLAAEQVSYQQLLDDARKEAAGRYLADRTLAICEIAYLVGYSEPAPFHRAFKRWYGTTPEAFRSRL